MWRKSLLSHWLRELGDNYFEARVESRPTLKLLTSLAALIEISINLLRLNLLTVSNNVMIILIIMT